MASQALNWRVLEQAVMDSEGPSQKLNQMVIQTVFKKMLENIEFTGLDFKQFFVLMSSIDLVYIYGKEHNGFLTEAEWQTMLKDNIVRFDILDNIDDCYVDKEEENENVKGISHKLRQQHLIESMGRFK